MATYRNPNDPASLAEGRYSEQRPPQFLGGSVDPSTGNLVPASKADAASGTRAAIEEDVPPPAQPTTRLADVKSPSLTDQLTNTALNFSAAAAGKALGESFSKGKAGSSPFDPPNPGGTTQTTGAGSGTGGYSPPSLPDLPGYGGGGGYGGSGGGGGGDSYSPPSQGYDPYSSTGGNYEDYSGGGAGGSKMICAELHRHGLLDGITYAADQAFGAMMVRYHPQVYAGYVAWARTCVRWMQASPRFTRFVKWFATPWAQYLSMRMGARKRAPLRGALIFHIGWAVCWTLGQFVILPAAAPANLKDIA